MTLQSGQRIADDEIYLHEYYFNNPKEIHKFVGDLVAREHRQLPSKVLDVGCAIGERIRYMQGRFPNFTFEGIDVSEAMIARAAALNPDARFSCGSVLDRATLPTRSCDITICGGVVAIFDDVGMPIRNLVETVRHGGILYISDTFNAHPVDVIMRYRRVDASGGHDWESGWNVFSKLTVEKHLRETGRIHDLTWHEFRLPFALPKRPDVMRTWTIETEQNPHQIVNGAAQILDTWVVRAQIAD